MAAANALDERRQNLLPNEVSENKENIQLIWLDGNLNDSDDCLFTKSLLLELNPAAQFYSDFDRCVDLIKSIKDERVFLIVSGTFARRILTQISTRQTVAAIFIFCSNRQYHQSLMNEHEKIIEIFTDQHQLLKSIRETMDLVEKQTLAFSLFDQRQSIGRALSKESATFLWNQMLIYVLKQMPQDTISKDQMLNMCRDYYRYDKKELKKIEEFRSSYSGNKAIEWYSDECFLYKLLNKALRTEDIELLYTFRFFIIDLCAAIEKESLHLKGKGVFNLYRGTQISNEELEKLKQNEGKIISSNGFLSTSRSINIAFQFARQSLPAVDFQPVVFEIEANSSLTTVVFADIEHITRMKGEQEVLFSLNALFEIISVDFDFQADIWKVKLTATDQFAEKAKEYITSTKQELDDYTPIIYFGRLLLYELGQMDRAEKYFQMLLKLLPSDHDDIAAVYNHIGAVHDLRDEQNLALKNYELAYKIRQERLPPNHHHIVFSLNNIGGIYKAKGNFSQALEYYQQALAVQGNNHLEFTLLKAMTMENIGRVYRDQGTLDIALDYLSRALDMFKYVLPPQHPDIARCLGAIGIVHEKKNNFENAIYFYYAQLDMDEQCLPPDHPDRSIHLTWIADIYKQMGEIDQALDFCREKLNAQKKTLGETHHCVTQTLITIAYVLEQKSPKEALDHYKQALSILEQSIPLDYRAISQCLISMASLHDSNDMLDDALQCNLRALDLYRKTLSSDHIYIAKILRNIGLSYQRMNNQPVALRYLNESLLIYRANYGPDHYKVKRCEADIMVLSCEPLLTLKPKSATINKDERGGSSSSQATSRPSYGSASQLLFDHYPTRSSARSNPVSTIKPSVKTEKCNIQ